MEDKSCHTESLSKAPCPPFPGSVSQAEEAGGDSDRLSFRGSAVETGEGVKEKHFFTGILRGAGAAALGIRKASTWVMLLPIRFYRRFLSPFKAPCCKFYPTCSTYALTAVSRFGPVKGGWLAVRRILRCHPWSLGGMDPVPEEYHFFHGRKRRT